MTLVVGLAVWRLFYPGLMSKDSITQYGQALTQRYSDWHPPLMAISLHFVLAIGGTLGLVTLGQCLGGVLGIRALAASFMASFFGPRLPPARREWAAFGIVVLLLIPVTPLAFFLMTLWKDTWTAVLLLWIGALGVALLDRGLSRRRLVLLIGLSVILGLLRHNALVVLLPIAILLWTALRPIGRWRALGIALAPLILYAAADPLIHKVFAVRLRHPSSQVMALDLLGLCAASQEVCAQLPWTRSHVLDPASLALYRPGDIGFIFWDQPKHVDLGLLADFPRLRAEYRTAAFAHPWLLAEIKATAFAQQLGIHETYYFFHGSIVENPFGLALDPRFAGARAWLAEVCGRVALHPWWRWVSGVHLVWLIVNAAGICVALLRARASGQARWRHLAALLLIPLSYYLSYLAATPVHDFRFMYPATLFVQCVTLAGALGALAQKPTGRAPSRAIVSA